MVEIVVHLTAELLPAEPTPAGLRRRGDELKAHALQVAELLERLLQHSWHVEETTAARLRLRSNRVRSVAAAAATIRAFTSVHPLCRAEVHAGETVAPTVLDAAAATLAVRLLLRRELTPEDMGWLKRHRLVEFRDVGGGFIAEPAAPVTFDNVCSMLREDLLRSLDEATGGADRALFTVTS